MHLQGCAEQCDGLKSLDLSDLPFINSKLLKKKKESILCLIFCFCTAVGEKVSLDAGVHVVQPSTRIINMSFHFSKSVDATVDSLMGTGCGKKV